MTEQLAGTGQFLVGSETALAKMYSFTPEILRYR
jgi:hypothetical protein